MKLQEILNKLCCCCSIKFGGRFLGWLWLIMSTINMIILFIGGLILSGLLKQDYEQIKRKILNNLKIDLDGTLTEEEFKGYLLCKKL